MSGNRNGVLAAFLCGAMTLAGSAVAQDKDKDKDKGEINVSIQGKDTDAGLVISAQATAKDIGLPLYPGARLHKDDKDDSSGVKLGLWAGWFGFKVVVLKMETNDSQEKVAAFYQKALGKYGKVLDCTNNPAGSDDKDKKSHELTCQDDRPDAGGRMFKAGTKEKQHIVSMKPGAAGSQFSLVYLEARGEEKTPL